MAKDLETLTSSLTREEIEAAIYQALSVKGVKTTGWKPGSVVRAFITGSALVMSSLSSLIALVARSGFLERSSGDWLTLVARHVYGVERIDATFASGSITLTNSGAGVYSGDAGDLIFTNASTGKTYTNTEAFSLAAFGSDTVGIRALEAGADSTSPATDIDVMSPVLTGVTALNEQAVVGTDAETDTLLKQRCLDKLGTLSPNGPADAYSFFARSALRADGTPIGVNRVRVFPFSATGKVDVQVATASGPVPGDELDPDTDLGKIAQDIRENVEPQTIDAHVFSAILEQIAVQYTVHVYDNIGLTDAQLKDDIESRILQFFSDVPIGGNRENNLPPGYVHLDALRDAIRGSHPEIFHVTIDNHTEDIPLLINGVPGLLGLVSATIVREPSING